MVQPVLQSQNKPLSRHSVNTGCVTATTRSGSRGIHHHPTAPPPYGPKQIEIPGSWDSGHRHRHRRRRQRLRAAPPFGADHGLTIAIAIGAHASGAGTSSADVAAARWLSPSSVSSVSWWQTQKRVWTG